MIDREKPHEYPAERLRAIKKAHIEKIRSLTSYVNLPKSQIILFGAKICEHESPLSYSAASKALLPDYVPQDAQGIRLQIQGLVITDDEEQYWKVQDQNLVRSFTAKVASLKGRTDIEHFSVFGLGPQPLLTRLGVLIGELQKVSCYQLSREPQTWCWRERVQTMQHSLVKSKLGQGSVALRFSLSAKISSDRIERVLGPDCAIWTVTHSNLNNDYLRSKEDLADFRKVTRQTLDEIKQLHGEAAVIHVFQAMPVSAAIELGRVWMPKADLPLILYDENKKNGGFHKTITITSNNQDEYYR
jgi:hypothetical protein